MSSVNLLQLQKAYKSFSSKQLFENASFSVNEDEHIGVIGPNGAGKSTLFKILTGHENLDEGLITKSSHLRLGYLPQHDEWKIDETVEDFLSRSTQTPLWTLRQLAKGLGIGDDLFSRPIASLSGGYRMRIKLIYLLGEKPNLMLLDEPTNYLDLETLVVLEQFLVEFKGAFLLISHDREFLKRVCDHTLEIEAGEMTKYNGHIEDYFAQKEMLAEQLQKAALQQAAKRAQIQEFIDRFGAKATKARQAQSRMKFLEKMEVIEVKPLAVRAEIRIPTPSIREKKLALSLSDARIGYDSKVILDKVNLETFTGDRVGVVGLNGQGKSTLLKALSGQLKLMHGELKVGQNISVGYYAQHVGEALDPQLSVFQELDSVTAPDFPRQSILDLAGSLLFSGSDVEKPIRVLSGGERARVALGKILLGRHSCLILDEPTNHLDFHTVEALSQALAKFSGSLFVVSHDRSFIRRVSTKIIEIDSGKVSLYPGSYEDYLWSLEKRMARENQDLNKLSTQQAKPIPKVIVENKDYLKRKQQQKRIDQLDKKINQLKVEIEASSGDLSAAQSSEVIKTLSLQIAAKQAELDQLELEWLELTVDG